MSMIISYRFDPLLHADARPNIVGGGTQKIKDKQNTDNTISRTITLSEYPSEVCFGNLGEVSKSIIEVLDYPMNPTMTSFCHLFDGCVNLINVDCVTWNTSNISDFRYCFRNCSSLTNLDVHNWLIKNLANGSEMFSGCTQLKSLNLTNWRTSVASPNFTNFLANCKELEELNLSHWNISNGFTITDMLTGNDNLRHVKMVDCSETTINKLITQLPTNVVDAKLYTSLNIHEEFINNLPAGWKIAKGGVIINPYFLNKPLKDITIKNCKVKHIHIGETKVFFYK